MREIEVLAPAGSFDTMKAAYKAGADAVYMGGPMFGARAYADMRMQGRCCQRLTMRIFMGGSFI